MTSLRSLYVPHGPTATNGSSPNREVRGKTTGQVQQLVVYPVVVGPPTGTDRTTQLLSLIRRFALLTRG